MAGLLSGIHGLARLPRCHKHNGLWRLTGLGVLVHHHWSTPARAWKPTMGLRGRSMVRIGVTRAWGVHLHMRGVGGHPLRDSHVRATGRLLDHHRCCHSSLWIYKLWCSRIMPHVRGLWRSLVQIKLRHGLLECQLRMRRHG